MPTISRTTFEPGDDLYFDEEGNAIPDSGFREAFKIAPGLPDFINAVREQGRKEGYELGQSEAFRKWRPEKSPEKPKRQRKPAGKATVFQQHLTPDELAQEWHVSGDFIRKLFRNEPGVMKIDRPETVKKRGYETMRIPLDVAQRVHRRLTTRLR